MIDNGVEVRPKLLVVDARNVFEGSDDLLGRHEPSAEVRPQFTDRLPIASHDEVLSRVERPHHLAAVVA